MDFSTAAANLPRPPTSDVFWRNKGVQSTTFERYGEELTTDEDEWKKNDNFQTNSSRASKNNAGKDPSWSSSSNGQNEGSNYESDIGGSFTLMENYGPTTQSDDPPQDDEWTARFGQIQRLAQEMTPAYVSASASVSTSDGDSSSSSLANDHEEPANLWTLLTQEMIDDKELRQWLMEQLQTAKNGKLHPSQAKRLLDLGLHWQESDHVWNKNYQTLLGNYELLNANPSAKVEDDSPELQNWIVVQKILSERHLLLPHRMKQLLGLARTLTTGTKDPVKAATSAGISGSNRDGKTSTAKAPSKKRRRRSDSSQAKLPPKKRKFIPFIMPPSEEEDERVRKRSKSPNDVTQLDELEAAAAPKKVSEPNEPSKTAFFKHTAHPILCLEEDDDDDVMEENDADDDKSSHNSSREDKEKIPFTTDVWDESIQAAHDLVDWIL